MYEALIKFLRSPATHLDSHPRALQLILNEMATGDQEADALLEAQQEMNNAVHLVHIASWQQGETRGSWKDFVLPDVMRVTKKEDTNRQMYVHSGVLLFTGRKCSTFCTAQYSASSPKNVTMCGN